MGGAFGATVRGTEMLANEVFLKPLSGDPRPLSHRNF